METYKYVFTRLREDISWIMEDKDVFDNSVIYNKGEPLGIENEIMTENVGKDAGSHLKFIIDNYDNLPDVCVFSQAKINDHYLYGTLGNMKSLKKLKEDAILHGESPFSTFHPDDKAWVKDWNFQEIEGHTHMLRDPALYKNNKPIVFIDWFNIHVDNKSTDVKRFHPCCIFSVSKQKILSRPKEYYVNLFNEINWHWNGIEIGFVERSWYHIFNPTYIEN